MFNPDKQVSEILINAIVLGGAESCAEVLEHIRNNISAGSNMTLLGFWNEDMNALDIKFAREHQIPVYSDLDKALALNGLNLIIDLSQSSSIRKRVQEKTLQGVSVIDHDACLAFMHQSYNHVPEEDTGGNGVAVSLR